MEEIIKKFLLVSYFGPDYSNKDKQIEIFINCAYRDLCRTIHYDCTDDEKDTFKREVKEYLVEEFSTLLQNENINKVCFDEKHKEWCEHLVKVGNNLKYKNSKKFTYGQAQKWINMSLKNMIVIGAINQSSNLIKLAHIPIDSIIIEKAKTKLGIDKPNSSWSNWNDYNEYKNYQDEIRNNMLDNSPIEWEFKAWNEQ